MTPFGLGFQTFFDDPTRRSSLDRTLESDSRAALVCERAALLDRKIRTRTFDWRPTQGPYLSVCETHAQSPTHARVDEFGFTGNDV